MARPGGRLDTKDRIQAWKSQIALAEKRLNREVATWTRCLRALANEIGPATYDDKEDYEPIAYIEAIVNRVVPRYYFRKPDVVVRPEINDPAMIEAAPYMEKWIEKLLDQSKSGVETRRTVVDALWANIGWVKVGYQSVFQHKSDLKEQIGADPAALPPQAGNFVKSEVIKQMGLDPDDLQVDDRIRSGRIFHQNVDPALMIVDPYARRFEDARWIGQRVPKRTEALSNSSLYPKKFLKNLKPTLTTSQIYAIDHPLETTYPISPTLREDHEDPSWIMLYEIWDRVEGKLWVLSDQADEEFWRDDNWPYQMTGFPYAPLQFNSHPRKLYGAPPIERWIALAKELNDYRYKRMVRVKRNVSKILFNAEGDTGETKDQLESAEEMGLVHVKNNAQVDLKRFVARLDPVNSPPDLNLADSRAREDLGDMAGESRQRRGQQGTYVTATEAAIIENASDEFDGDRIQLVAQHQEEVIYRMMALAGQFYETDDYVSVMGVDGYKFFDISTQLIASPWHITVRVGSSRFLSAEQELQLTREALQVALTSPPGTVDLIYILKQYYRQMGYPENVVIDPNTQQGQQRLNQILAARVLMGIDPNAGGAGGGLAPFGAQGSQATGGQAGGGPQPGAGRPPSEQSLANGAATNGAA